MLSLNNMINNRIDFVEQMEKARTSGKPHMTEQYYNNVIKEMDILIRSKERETIDQLEKDTMDAVNTIEAPNHISDEMKNQLEQFDMHQRNAISSNMRANVGGRRKRRKKRRKTLRRKTKRRRKTKSRRKTKRHRKRPSVKHHK